MTNPTWWTDKHEGVWTRTKEALKRDWDQTKHDFSSHGKDLDQSAGDTVKQAAGKEPIPTADQPNRKETWDDVEPAYRYGAGAHEQYGKSSWSSDVESRLADDWNGLKNGQTWSHVKASVRAAWDSVDRKAK